MRDAPDEPTLPRAATGHDAVRYVRALVWWIGPGFHPDSNFHEYVSVDTEKHLFGIDQANRLNKELERAIGVLDGFGVEVYDVAAPVQSRMLREAHAINAGLRP